MKKRKPSQIRNRAEATITPNLDCLVPLTNSILLKLRAVDPHFTIDQMGGMVQVKKGETVRVTVDGDERLSYIAQEDGAIKPEFVKPGPKTVQISGTAASGYEGVYTVASEQGPLPLSKATGIKVTGGKQSGKVEEIKKAVAEIQAKAKKKEIKKAEAMIDEAFDEMDKTEKPSIFKEAVAHLLATPRYWLEVRDENGKWMPISQHKTPEEVTDHYMKIRGDYPETTKFRIFDQGTKKIVEFTSSGVGKDYEMKEPEADPNNYIEVQIRELYLAEDDDSSFAWETVCTGASIHLAFLHMQDCKKNGTIPKGTRIRFWNALIKESVAYYNYIE